MRAKENNLYQLLQIQYHTNTTARQSNRSILSLQVVIAFFIPICLDIAIPFLSLRNYGLACSTASIQALNESYRELHVESQPHTP